MAARLTPGLERRLKADVSGDVWFDRFNRGRYATDASFYQIMPLGVVVPRTTEEAERAIALARAEGIPVTPRGGGTSQCGQTINDSLVIDGSKHLNRILELDVANRRCVVEPGIVLDDLNRVLKPHGLWFPVDVSTASRATIGGMAGNNSCGGRSLRYGTMRDNVLSIDAMLANGDKAYFGPVDHNLSSLPPDSPLAPLARDLFDLGAREAGEVAARFPAVQRRVGGYNLDALVPNPRGANLAHILVGSEGTLAYSTRIELKLWPLIGKKVIGACHFGSFYQAMDAAQHLVKLKPIAVELVDATLLALAGEIPMFQATLKQFVRGTPDAILLVEFAEDEAENERRLKLLEDTVGDLGFGWDREGANWGGVVSVREAGLQAAIADVRTSGLNIMMSMKQAGKPVSFVEDCAVPLPHLADYTARLTEVFERNGTRGTWYAHASEGCLHVRPVLNLRLEKDVKAMRAIAEEAFAMVRAYKGSHSGEHGDGIVRSEFHETMYGTRLVRAFEEVKDRFDPGGLYNPGKIVRAPKFDDRSLFRYAPDYKVAPIKAALDWSGYSGEGGGLQGAIEMCNNNGACRKAVGGVMCPSYRVTRDEKDVTRGRANTLRLALSGRLGPDALASDEMMETLKLCVSCKGCRRECPTGVDMAKMKIEALAARAKAKGITLHQRLVAYMPRYAGLASKVPWLLNLRDTLPGAAKLSEIAAQFSARRTLPRWRADAFRQTDIAFGPEGGREVVLFADTFNRWFEKENVVAALEVLVAAGYRVHMPRPVDGGRRALCCGRTFLSAGLVDEAKAEARRVVETYAPFVARGVPVVGLEPSCLLAFRDELPSMLPGEGAQALSAHALLIEEFIAREIDAGRFDLPLAPLAEKALLHGHCHQKSFGAMGAVEKALRLVPGLHVETVESSCCGMAGAFGYHSETIDTSLAMAELSLLPAVRKAEAGTLIVADGTSCRHQIHDGAAREAVHVVAVLARSLKAARAEGLVGQLTAAE
ncbi:FAD/FMN-containing dehydrogenase [Ancylobacter aquaticus]|uniref:D-2-hydroxyglutarate dehydrogenase n=1 Tax=Ancylobacter aquaticus TaxID=100 RepID=A0A4R1IE24_ANCAQ|nr:FAD-binding and (Fe-S)-binding domain-containing protein [Ancylobacter aquaticus]TCK29022.1 FAD/FMN-containing dehydrogenase [Ancylobacter aquaticus]